jgi:DeoR family transcriptional regulator, aga operon transcriptional repressor
MIEKSREVILLAGSSKFSRKSFAFVCRVDQIDYVITDERIKGDDEKRLKDAGVEVFIA